MSYDITLNDPVTDKTIELDSPHQMAGGTYALGGTTKAWLNITYNYANYYYDATEGDNDFYRDGENKGIRGLYGKSGAESIPMLKRMIQKITDMYPDLQTNDDYWAGCPCNAIKPLYQLLAIAQMRPDGVWDSD